MIRMDVEKLIDCISEIEDRRNPEDNPVLGYLHDLIVLSTLRENAPSVAEVDFEAFTVADLEEYNEIAVNAVENTFPMVEQIVRDMDKIKSLHSNIMEFF